MTKVSIGKWEHCTIMFYILKSNLYEIPSFYDKTITIYEIKQIFSIAEEIKLLLYNQVYLYMFHKFINK